MNFILVILFVVLEKCYEEEIAIAEIKKYIDIVLSPEERPLEIIPIKDKPIRGFKTDRKLLKEMCIS